MMKTFATVLLAAIASADEILPGTGAICHMPESSESAQGSVKLFMPDPIECLDDFVHVRARFGNLDFNIANYSVDVYESEGLDDCMAVEDIDLLYALGMFAPQQKKDRVRGGFCNNNLDISLAEGDIDNIVGKYIGLSNGGSVVACCRVELQPESDDEVTDD